ncbi:MAG: class I SAM-dependent methyltransferase [Actinomycetota bacterium]
MERLASDVGAPVENGHGKMPKEIAERLEEQLEYYRTRAPEYDLWAERQGPWARDPGIRKQWFDEITLLEAALDVFEPRGRILEIACGTGAWTERLARHTNELTAMDAAPEVLDINRARPHGENVEFIHADIFSWTPTEKFDVIFFSFWLSHVPPALFDRFWEVVGQALVPGGRVFVIDNVPSEDADKVDPELPGPDANSVVRKVTAGDAFRVFKVLYTPDELEERVEPPGWDLHAKSTGSFFLYASGQQNIPD